MAYTKRTSRVVRAMSQQQLQELQTEWFPDFRHDQSPMESLLFEDLEALGVHEQLIGCSSGMQELQDLIEQVAQSDCMVLIQGETGTGKERVARAIHLLSPRSQSAFVPIDCTCLNAQLADGELFGYRKGSFTGADHDRVGLLQSSRDGTILLDEITELPLELQGKLLRMLQEREFRPVGATNYQPLRARVIAATNCDLQQAVREGKFRQDLFYRLNVVLLEVPPLRERTEDIPLLIGHFVQQRGLPPLRLTRRALTALQHWHWPGNVRELENLTDRWAALGCGDVIDLEDLPHEIFLPVRGRPDSRQRNHSVPATLEEAECHSIRNALQRCRGNKTAAADLLGISKSTLYQKLRRHGLLQAS